MENPRPTVTLLINYTLSHSCGTLNIVALGQQEDASELAPVPHGAGGRADIWATEGSDSLLPSVCRNTAPRGGWGLVPLAKPAQLQAKRALQHIFSSLVITKTKGGPVELLAW